MIVAFDVGKSTGVCVERDGRYLCRTFHCETNLDLFRIRAFAMSMVYKYQALIILEDFRVGGGEYLNGDDLIPVQIIGAIRSGVDEDNVVMQTPAQAKFFYDDKKMEAYIGVWHNNHEKDALRHILFYQTKGGLI